jgi:hypothetical protein
MITCFLPKIPSMQNLYFDLTSQTSLADQSDRFMCPKTHVCSSETVYPFLSSLFVPKNLYMCCIPFISGKAENMSSGRPSTQYYEWRKKRCHDVDVGEGSSRDVPLRRSAREAAHRDLPRGHMHIDTDIEE